MSSPYRQQGKVDKKREIAQNFKSKLIASSGFKLRDKKGLFHVHSISLSFFFTGPMVVMMVKPCWQGRIKLYSIDRYGMVCG